MLNMVIEHFMAGLWPDLACSGLFTQGNWNTTGFNKYLRNKWMNEWFPWRSSELSWDQKPDSLLLLYDTSPKTQENPHSSLRVLRRICHGFAVSFILSCQMSLCKIHTDTKKKGKGVRASSASASLLLPIKIRVQKRREFIYKTTRPQRGHWKSL